MFDCFRQHLRWFDGSALLDYLSAFVLMRLLILRFYATMPAHRFWSGRKRDTLPQNESKKAGIRIEMA